MENPLNNYPGVRKALYLVQWVYNGLAALAGAYFLVEQTAPEDLPRWYVIAIALGPVLWTYLGLTAQNNVPSVRDVVAGDADAADVAEVVREEGEHRRDDAGESAVMLACVVALVVIVVLVLLGVVR